MVGDLVGRFVGLLVGCPVSPKLEGEKDGSGVGDVEGVRFGDIEGVREGLREGLGVGDLEGLGVGDVEGLRVGGTGDLVGLGDTVWTMNVASGVGDIVGDIVVVNITIGNTSDVAVIKIIRVPINIGVLPLFFILGIIITV